MKPLTPDQKMFWETYLATLPPERRPREPFVEAAFAGDARVTDALIALYLDGRKTAGSSLAADFRTAGDPLPAPGNFWIALDGKSRPRLILRTERVVRFRFKDVPPTLAAAEGEGDMSVAAWKRIHRAAYAPFLARWGIDDLDEAEVIAEHFALLRGISRPAD